MYIFFFPESSPGAFIRLDELEEESPQGAGAAGEAESSGGRGRGVLKELQACRWGKRRRRVDKADEPMAATASKSPPRFRFRLNERFALLRDLVYASERGLADNSSWAITDLKIWSDIFDVRPDARLSRSGTVSKLSSIVEQDRPIHANRAAAGGHSHLPHPHAGEDASAILTQLELAQTRAMPPKILRRQVNQRFPLPIPSRRSISEMWRF
jgi:hypothetical protein